MWLSEQVWDHRLHAAAREERRWVVLEDEWRALDSHVLALVKKLQICGADLLGVHLCYCISWREGFKD